MSVCEYRCVDIDAQGGQRHQILLELVTGGCGCWELNSSPFKNSYALLPTESSLQCLALLYAMHFFKIKGSDFIDTNDWLI